MIDQTTDVLVCLKRMDDAQVRSGGKPRQSIEGGQRVKLTLAFGRARENEVKSDA